DVAAYQVHLDMGEVDHADDAVDHGVADGDQGVGAADGQAVEQLLNQVVEPVWHVSILDSWPGTTGYRAAGALLGQSRFAAVRMPLVDHVVEVLQVSFLVKGQLAGGGVEGVAAQGLSDLGLVVAAGQADAVGNDLYRRIGGEHES